MLIQPEDFPAELQAALGTAYIVEHEPDVAGTRRSGGSMGARAIIARESASGRRVVVNVVPDAIAVQVDTRLFCREAELATSLRHPQLIPLLGAGTAGPFLYYLTPLLDGESLRGWLDASGGRLPILEAIRITIDVAGALQAAHEQGIVHRDVTPENVFLTGAHAVVTNAGLSRAVSRSLLQPAPGGWLTGTPAYMSPEQAAGATNLDGRSDIYSLGCVLYEMLTGTRPFAGVRAVTLGGHVPSLPQPPRRHRTEIAQSLDGVVTKALAPRPEGRYATAAELRQALLGETAHSHTHAVSRASFILSRMRKAFFALRREGESG